MATGKGSYEKNLCANLRRMCGNGRGGMNELFSAAGWLLYFALGGVPFK
jgi:hypothetical protein